MRLTIKLRNYAAVLMTIVLSAIAVTSCSDSDSQQPDVYCTALVTYERSTPAPEGSDNNTATSYFTYYGDNDAMPTTLTAKANMPSSMKQGQRCILSFIPNDFANPTATGMVELVRCLNVSTTTMQTAPAASGSQCPHQSFIHQGRTTDQTYRPVHQHRSVYALRRGPHIHHRCR